MSQIIGATSGGLNGLSIMTEDDDRLKPEFVGSKHPGATRDIAKDPSNTMSNMSAYWPGAGAHALMGDAGDVYMQSAIWHALPEITRGQSASYYISGYARNAAGQPISGVTLKLFLTSTDQLVSTTTSNSDGSYSLNTGYGGAGHYIVAYLSGGGIVPDIEGTSVNTLVPGIPGA